MYKHELRAVYTQLDKIISEMYCEPEKYDIELSFLDESLRMLNHAITELEHQADDISVYQ